MKIEPRAVPIEPSIKNTAPTVPGACMQIVPEDPEGIMIVTPTDHE